MTIGPIDVLRLLTAAGYYAGDIDGDIGPKAEAGIDKLLGKHLSELSADPANWSLKRRSIAALQLVLKYAGYDEVGAIDGLAGTMTDYAYGLYEYEKLHGKRPAADWRPDDFEPVTDDEPPELEKNVWPYQRDMTKIFGTPGGSQCTAGKVNLPFKMRIAWDLDETVSRFSCHEMVADSAQRVYERVSSAYSPEDISRHGFDLFGGCYNYRKKRGGRTLSTHAYGIAIDHDPIQNRLKWGRDRAHLATKECEEFWKCWEAEGWLSLGRARNFDWMHVQAARL